MWANGIRTVSLSTPQVHSGCRDRYAALVLVIERAGFGSTPCW